MSSNERHGSSDAGADQGLAAHWAIVSLTIFGVVVISCYSQYKCHALERRGIRLRAVATALQTSLVLVLWYLFPLMSLVQGAANAGINCFWYVFWPHLCIGGVIGIHAHRILTFTYNLAQNETFSARLQAYSNYSTHTFLLTR
uniref:Uncharacterized protein n=1 Tax=Amorphochlora amoebiformis TaxID=1561963 RepID=A0A7S0H1X1_9EUKA